MKIPAKLQAIKTAKYCAVRLSPRGAGKTAKIPIGKDGECLDTTTPDVGWLTLGAAVKAARKSPAGETIGVLMRSLPGVIGIDLDNCIDENGNLKSPFDSIVRNLPGYWEVSPSGKGLRGFGFGTLAQDLKSPGIEVYAGHSARYLTITGRKWKYSTADLTEYSTGGLNLLQRLCAPKRVCTEASAPKPAPVGIDPVAPRQAAADVLTGRNLEWWSSGDSTGFRGDNSGAYGSCVRALFSGGWAPGEVLFATLADDHPAEWAARHRGDEEAQIRYLTKYQLLPIWDRFQREGDFVARELRADASEALPPVERPTHPRISFTASDPYLDVAPLPSWRVENVLPQQGIACMYGAPGAGKSFLAMDVAWHIASGKSEWFGHECKKGDVFWLCGEGEHDFTVRLQEYRHRFAEGKDNFFAANLDMLNGFRLPYSLEVANPASIQSVIDDINAKKTSDHPVIIFDTLSSILHPDLDENSSRDMNRLIAACKTITRHTGALVILIHHSGKNSQNGARGSSALRAAVDVEIAVEAVEDCDASGRPYADPETGKPIRKHRWRVSKSKGGPSGEELFFLLNPVDTLCRDGEFYSTCVVGAPEDARERQGGVPLSIRILDALSVDTEGALDEKLLLDVINANGQYPVKPSALKIELRKMLTNKTIYQKKIGTHLGYHVSELPDFEINL